MPKEVLHAHDHDIYAALACEYTLGVEQGLEHLVVPGELDVRRHAQATEQVAHGRLDQLSGE
ncbi:hypothetical protein OSJ16_12235 [Mycobacterium ulcerans]